MKTVFQGVDFLRKRSSKAWKKGGNRVPRFGRNGAESSKDWKKVSVVFPRVGTVFLKNFQGLEEGFGGAGVNGGVWAGI